MLVEDRQAMARPQALRLGRSVAQLLMVGNRTRRRMAADQRRRAIVRCSGVRPRC
jgi:hypothetical protein